MEFLKKHFLTIILCLIIIVLAINLLWLFDVCKKYKNGFDDTDIMGSYNHNHIEVITIWKNGNFQYTNANGKKIRGEFMYAGSPNVFKIKKSNSNRFLGGYIIFKNKGLSLIFENIATEYIKATDEPMQVEWSQAIGHEKIVIF